MPDTSTAPRIKRPFWMHQAVEYVLGGVLLVMGLQSPTPAVPAVLGLLVAANAAITRGPLAAFRWVGPGTHRMLDGILLVVMLVGAVQPWIDIDAGTRVIVLGVTAVFAMMWWQTSFRERSREQVPPGDRAADAGRRAGRMVGSAINTIKKPR